jgi:hypothetical protein
MISFSAFGKSINSSFIDGFCMSTSNQLDLYQIYQVFSQAICLSYIVKKDFPK